jgi:hypothetical protein
MIIRSKRGLVEFGLLSHCTCPFSYPVYLSAIYLPACLSSICLPACHRFDCLPVIYLSACLPAIDLPVCLSSIFLPACHLFACLPVLKTIIFSIYLCVLRLFVAAQVNLALEGPAAEVA